MPGKGSSAELGLFGLALFTSAAAIVYASITRRRQRRERSASMTRMYSGQCHCGAVSFTCSAPQHLVTWVCDCSICDMNKNFHFVIPEDDFRLVTGRDALTLYEFNTKTAKHLFCKVCGVTPFYRPRSNPDGYAITLSCIVPPEQVTSFEYRHFNGLNWEKFYQNSGIQAFSSPSPAHCPSSPSPSPSPSTPEQSPAPSSSRYTGSPSTPSTP